MALDPFRIRDHVADFDAIVADIRARSEETRRTLTHEANIAYGDGPDETLDLFMPAVAGPDIPIHLFIHGGYWRMFSKDDYSCIAQTVTQAGAIAAIVDYTLMPKVRLEVLVDQMHRAAAFLLANATRFGASPGHLTVSGHSAGAHLATFLFDRTDGVSGVRSAFLLGGLYDLAPLQSSFLQAEIALTDGEVDRFSPLTRQHLASTRVEILTGEDETPPFHQQAQAFHERLASQGLAVRAGLVPGGNHMSAVRDLADPETSAGRALTAFITENSPGKTA